MRSDTPLPFLTAELPGTGGRLKQRPEDFFVEEIPAYDPCGEGEHLFLWIEKTDVAADELLRHIARHARHFAPRRRHRRPQRPPCRDATVRLSPRGL